MSDPCQHCSPGETLRPAAAPSGAPDAHTLRVRIANMDCPTEEALIRKALGQLPGVDNLGFDLINRVLTVVHRLDDPASLYAALAEIGMAAQSVEPATADRAEVSGASGQRLATRRWWLALAGGAAALGAEAVAYATGDETSWTVAALALIAIAISGPGTLRKGWIALRSLTLNINLLMSVAVIGAALIGQWPEAAVVIWLFGVAEMIEAASMDRARNAIRQLVALAPELATVRDAAGGWREVAVSDIAHDAVVRIRPGERVALDGVVVSGESSVNQAPITGESMPVDKKAGDMLFAGTINQRGTMEFRVTASKGDTTLDRIARSVQEAQGQRAPTQRFVDQFARIYTPVVFAVAILVALVPPVLLGQPWHDWIYRALVLLVIACPCALVISTPVTVVSGLAAAARRGMVVKGGLYLEQGRRLRTLALDKTGTLTHGKPALTDVVPVAELSEQEALRLAASLDALSEHPVAAAIVAAYGGKPLAHVANFEALPGYGAKGVIDGVAYYIGNHRLIEELKICSPSLEAVLDRLEDQAKTAVVLAQADRPVAVFAVADQVRASSAAVIADLKSLGITPVMLTGDNVKTARAVAAQLGIDDVRGNLLPQDKLAAIAALCAVAPTGMVGDGVNDAPALAKSDIGFAMAGGGTDTAIETADVALMQDDLRRLPDFIRLSRRTASILRQNITVALGIKAVFLVLTMMGQATLWMAVFADMGASLIVVFNGLRVLNHNQGQGS